MGCTALPCASTDFQLRARHSCVALCSPHDRPAPTLTSALPACLSCRPLEGSLLPLWQFVCEQGRKHVTSMCWSSLYADQFAVGYGSFHYQRQGTGAISIFSLKNPSHAELTVTTESGAQEN